KLPHDVASLTPQTIASWLEYLRAKGRSNTTLHGRRVSLVTFLRWCVKDGHLERSPLDGTKGIKPDVNPVPVIPDDVLAKLFKACSGRDFYSLRASAL